jgi:hypothetical protein
VTPDVAGIVCALTWQATASCADKTASRVINHLGDEVMKVLAV